MAFAIASRVYESKSSGDTTLVILPDVSRDTQSLIADAATVPSMRSTT